MLETVKRYIYRQEEHHANNSLEQELESFDKELLKYYDPAKHNAETVPAP